MNGCNVSPRITFFGGNFCQMDNNPGSCHRMKTSILEWVGLVPRSAEWSPDMSVFVVYAKPVSRPRDSDSEGSMPGRENERLQLGDRSNDPQLDHLFTVYGCAVAMATHF